jgi:hypothetical protein
MKDTPKLMLPLQSAPVDRTLGAAALSEGLGVEASQNTGQIVGSILQTALPLLASLF